jgi:tetratricopeptide (TPR) repeat protein
MRWEVGSPTMPEYNWFRWSHAYLILGSLFCFALYIPTVIAIIKKRLKFLALPAILIVFFIIGSIALAVIGRNSYYEQQVGQLKKNVESNPSDSLVLENLATAYSNSGKYDKAIETFNKALSITANPAYVIHDRGSAYAGAESYDLAIADYTKAIELKSGEKDFVAQCYNDRGVAYFKSGKYQQSYEDVSRALEMGYNVHPGFLSALESKGFKKVSR